MTPAEIFGAAPKPSFWRERVPSLHIEDTGVPSWSTGPPSDSDREQLWREGWVKLPHIVPKELVEGLAAGIRQLHDADIPTPCIFVFDEPWQVATGLSAAMQALLSPKARVLPDVWAWFIPAETGARGWAPHRGVTVDVRNAEGIPTLVNVWVALSDVTEASACIRVVPLPKDEHHPHALERADVKPGHDLALPVSAGGVLVWNANILHSGGAMQEGAPARISLSFSFDTGKRVALAPVPPPFEARVDLIADMLVTYREVSGTTGSWLEWAQLWCGMRDVRVVL